MLPLIYRRPLTVAIVIQAVWAVAVWYLTGEWSPLP